MRAARVDVIIPTFNRAYCLARAIDSVIGQTHAGCRAIVVDDGSTDDTRALVTGRYSGNSQVHYVHQPNQGVVAARNRALGLVEGEFVAFLDSDDLWRDWKVEVQIGCLASLPPEVGMVWTDMDAVDGDGRIVKERYLRTMYGAYQRYQNDTLFEHARTLGELGLPGTQLDAATGVYWGDIFSAMVTGNLVHTSTALLKRERVAAVGRFDERLRPSGEDFDFHLRTCRAGPVAFVDAASIAYRVGADDQLTSPAYRVHIAENFLKTIEPVLTADRDRIRLPQASIDATLARAHAWIADTRFETCEFGAARHHAWQSLTYRPWQRRPWLLWALSVAPAPVRDGVLAGYRGLKRSLRKAHR